ncbi:MAG: MoaD/ThiS family protein [Desulfobacterales bacterium]
MRIVVRLYNELKRHAPGIRAGGELDVPPGSTVRDVLTLLGIPPDRQAGLPLFRNGRPADLDTSLEEGDALVAFSPMSGG